MISFKARGWARFEDILMLNQKFVFFLPAKISTKRASLYCLESPSQRIKTAPSFIIVIALLSRFFTSFRLKLNGCSYVHLF